MTTFVAGGVMTTSQQRILALDVGESRVGTSISDPLGLTAQPGPTLDRKPDTAFFAKLGEIIEQGTVIEVVLGLPVGLKGQRSGKSFEAVMELFEECRKRWPEVIWKTWDERFTTVTAIQTLSSAPKKKRQQKGLRDQIAAQLILDSYMRSRPAK
jgi:putative holliday junction resolvase